MGTAASGNAGVGTIKVVTGDVKIIGVDGVARQAQVGDKVFAKETIQTNANAIVQVQLENGRMLDLGRDSKIALDDDVLNVGQGPSTAPAAAATTDIAALQAQIAAGADPSKVAEATAAGGAPGAGGTADGSGGTAVYVDQANSTGEVTSGFNTGIGGIAFPDIPPGTLPVIDNVPVVSVSVSVQVQVQVDVGVSDGTGGTPSGGGGLPGDTDGDGVVVSGNVANLIEGTGPGSRVVNFIISLDKVFDVDVTVNYQIVPGTAQVGSDITLTNGLTGSVTIPAGQISFIVPVNIVQDSNIESNETFSIVLTGATNATINPAASTAQAVIFDDDIQARPDTNWAKEDGVAATGNVLTGGSHSPDARGDDPSSSTTFADQGDLNTALATMSVVNTGTFAGNYGALVLNANGSYTYTLYTQAQNPEAYAAVQALDDGESLPPESFSYTARNSLGGASVSTLQITVFGSNDAPTIDAQTNVRVSEEGLEGRFGFGNPDNDGNQDTTNTTFVSGTITVGDVDVEPLTVVLHAPTTALTSHGQTIVWSGEGTGMLTGSIPNGEGSIPVITITITNTGAYTVTLLGPIDHAGANVEDDKSFNVGVTVSDGTASTNGNMTVTVEDDSPIITTYRQGYVPQLIVDESTLANDAKASFAGAFGFVQFGSDGAAAANSQVYTLGITANTDSGLIDSLTQQHVILSVTSGGVVEGRTTGGDLVFTVSVNAGTGEVTLDQLRAVMHDTATNPDTSEGVTLSGLVTLTLTVKDFDLDTASQTVNIGNALQFNDDGPSISVATTLGECEQIIPVPEPTLTVDETDLSTNAIADFSGNFTSAFGADGPGAITYALGVSEQGVDSGLIDVATGEPIFLYVNEAGVVEGRVGSDGEANPEGAVDFTVSVDANGVVTLDQIHPLQHPDAQNPDDPVSMADNLITLTATITDRDDDSATATLNIGGNMSFEDDGPTLTVNTPPTFSALSVVEASAGAGQTVTITAPTYTASAVDGYTDTVSYDLAINGGPATGLSTTSGFAITLVQVNPDTIQGQYNGGQVAFTVSISGNQVTLVSNVALEHSNTQGSGEDNTLDLGSLINVVATVTVTDGDNDQIVNSTSAISPLSLTISDTDPTLTVNTPPTFSALSVVEASAGAGQTVTITAPTYTASAVDGYTDTVSYDLAINGGPATGLSTTSGFAITLVQVNPDTIQGQYNGGQVAFTVSISGNQVTLVSNVALEHSNTQGSGEDNTLDLGSLINVVATVTVTDGDNDQIVNSTSAISPLSLTISDTDPTLTVNTPPTFSALSVVEASAGAGQTVTITAPTYTASAVDGYTDTVSYDLAINGGPATGLSTTSGFAITLVQVNPDTIQGQYNGGQVAFTVSISGNQVTLVSNVALEHSNTQGSGEDNTLDLGSLINVVATVTVTDGDNDQIVNSTSAISPLSLTISDTDPTLTVNTPPTFSALSVVEASAGAGQTVTITAPTYTASAVDGYTDTVSYDLAINGGPATGLSTTSGFAITLVQVNPDTIQGQYNGGQVAFTVSISGNQVTLVSNVALEHSNTQGSGEDNTLDLGSLINVVATVTVTDGDNDQIVNSTSAISPLSLTISDTDPTLTVNTPPTFSALSVVEASGALGSQTVTITAPTFTAGAVDSPLNSTNVSYALSTTNNVATNLQTTVGNFAITLVQVDATHINGVYNGSSVAFTITLSGSSVTLTSLVALEHSNTQGAGEINTLNLGTLINVVATVTVTDGDGDVISTSAGASAPLSLTISDTDPKLVVPETIFVEDKGVVGTTDQVVANLNFTSGADGVGSVKFNAADISANLTGDALTAGATTSAVAAKDAAGNNLLVGGQQLYLYLSADGTTLTASTGTTAGGTVGFTLSLNGGAGTYTFNPEAVITNGTEVSSSTIQTVGGGNKDWKAFINLGGTSQDAFLTTKGGADPDSVNTNNGEIGISDGNSFKVGEGLRIDLVNGLTTSGSGGGETFSITGPYNLTNSFRQIVTFTNQGNANITLSAIVSNDLSAPFYGDSNDPKVNLSTSDIKIYNGTTLVTGLTMTDNADGSITINGIQANWTFEINSATQFNAVQIDAATGSGQFKLGVFSYGNEFVGTQIDLNYNVIATDGDNDAVAGQLGITLTRDAITTTGDNLTGTAGDDVLIGTSANSTLSGGDGNDVLAGNSGNDSLTGGNGNDILIGGAGSDNMTGSAGSDTFKWNNGDQGSGAVPTDTVTDFNTAAVASGGDVLNLKDLLVLENHAVGNGNLGSFLSFAQTGSDVTLTVHSQGAAGPVDQTIVLQNTNMTALAGANTADSAGVIANLLSQGKLITD